jgi:hypothetical protein
LADLARFSPSKIEPESSPHASFDASNLRLNSGGVHRPDVDNLPLSAAWRQWGWLSLPSS